jgi:CBS-domain-containing membrane protein
MRIDRLMSKPAITCGESDTLNAAAHLMWTHDCGVIPVVNQSGHLVGIVTDRDICMAAYTQGRLLHWIPVSTVMTKQVHSCRAADSIEYAEALMSEKQVRRLPVIDEDGRPVGLLSLGDIARHATRRRRRRGARRGVVKTLAAVCEPWERLETTDQERTGS